MITVSRISRRGSKPPGQTAHGHLAQLAKANGAVLATLDTKIRGAFVIPAGK
jgi:hypothetical protein